MRFKRITAQSVLVLLCSGLFSVNVLADSVQKSLHGIAGTLLSAVAPPPPEPTVGTVDGYRGVTLKVGEGVYIEWFANPRGCVSYDTLIRGGYYWRAWATDKPTPTIPDKPSGKPQLVHDKDFSFHRNAIGGTSDCYRWEGGGSVNGFKDFGTKRIISVELCNPANVCTSSVGSNSLELLPIPLPEEPIVSAGNWRQVTRKVGEGVYIGWFTKGNATFADIRGGQYYWRAWATDTQSGKKQLVHDKDTHFVENSYNGAEGYNGAYRWEGAGGVDGSMQIGTRIISVELCNPDNRCRSSSNSNSLTVVTVK